MTMITPSYLGETIEYSSLHACRSTLEDPTGIILTGEQFIDLPRLTPGFERRLRAWGSDSPDEAIGSAITIRTPPELVEIIRSRPGTDFYIPSGLTTVFREPLPTHRPFRYSASRVFLLSDQAGQRTGIAAIPSPW